MPGEVLSRCGYRCDLCLAWRPNVEREDRRALLSDGWHKYFGFRIPPERIICDGCTAPGRPRLVDTGCPVRPCVLSRGLEHCGGCPEYVCDKAKERLVDRRELEAKLGQPIADEDYELFIKPYESKAWLELLRR